MPPDPLDRRRPRRAGRRLARPPPRPLPRVPGRHDRAGRRHPLRARHRRPSRRGRDRRDRSRRTILLVRQWRTPAGRALLEIPAGTLDVDEATGAIEDPDLAARRELEEETGYRAGTWQRLTAFWTAPGFTSELMHLYLATDLVPGPPGRAARARRGRAPPPRAALPAPTPSPPSSAARSPTRSRSSGCSGSPACAAPERPQSSGGGGGSPAGGSAAGGGSPAADGGSPAARSAARAGR